MTESKAHFMLPDLLKHLEELSKKQQLIEQAIENCKTTLISCIEEDEKAGLEPLKGWKLDEIKIVFERQSLVFKHSVLAYPYIDTQMGLYVHDPEKIHFDNLYPMGKYRLITHLDGEVIDDYLVIEERPETR
jgi:hypothetical protein